jgi:hypothetical protein
VGEADTVTQRKLRIEVTDESGHVTDDTYRSHTIAAVEVELPSSMEVPGERLIEAAKLAYRHVVGSDLPGLIVEGEPR